MGRKSLLRNFWRECFFYSRMRMNKQTKEKIKIIPLGGVGEIGKNMTVVEYGNDMVIIDCGIIFPDESMPGIDVVIPDISYIKNNLNKTFTQSKTCRFNLKCPNF